jgi:hypothetical protein
MTAVILKCNLAALAVFASNSQLIVRLMRAFNLPVLRLILYLCHG